MSHNASAEPLSVALLLPGLEAGGTERAQLLLARGLLELGCTVTLVTVRENGPLRDELPDGITHHALKGSSSWSPRTVNALGAFLRANRPALLISALNEANLLAWRSIRPLPNQQRPKHVMTVHNNFEAKWRARWTPTAPLRRSLFRFLYRRADAVVTVSQGLREYLVDTLRIPTSRVRAIPNVVEYDRIRKLSSEAIHHRWFEDPSGAPLWITVGRLVPQKDHATLVQALARTQVHPSPRLIIVGEGPERNALSYLCDSLGISDRVDFVGYQKNPYAWMARAHGFVLSSQWEGYPLVLLEARALELPVVSTDCPTGPAELADRFGGICLVPRGDVSALAQALETTPPRSSSPPSEAFSCQTMARDYLKLSAE